MDRQPVLRKSGRLLQAAVLLAVTAGGLCHCGDHRPVGSAVPAGEVGAVVLEVEYARPVGGAAKAAVVQGRLRITGEGMAPLDTVLQVRDGRLGTRIDRVPVGERRVGLTLTGIDAEELWQGETTVEVRSGVTTAVELKLERVGDGPPSARLVEAPAAVNIDSLFTLRIEAEDRHDASDSLQVRWDFEGDGNFDTEWSFEHSVTHIFARPGNFTLGLQVRDQSGRIGALTQSLRVTDITAVELPGGTTMSMVWIEPGRFLMGAPAGEANQDADEGPQHEVEITRGFYIGQYELTQGQWEGVMGTRPWAGSGWAADNPLNPAVNFTWEEAQEFIARLNTAAGVDIYRLPTEAEWEYAARAGTVTPWSFGDDESRLVEYAWYAANTCLAGACYSQRGGRKLPNGWGLFDCYGNVWEWVQDWYDEAYYLDAPRADPQGPEQGRFRVRRGGGFFEEARYLRSANRGSDRPDNTDYDMGMRLVRQMHSGG